MCLSTAYIRINDQDIEVMRDIARIESQNNDFLLIGLLGKEKRVRGKIRSIDFIDHHSVVFENGLTESE